MGDFIIIIFKYKIKYVFFSRVTYWDVESCEIYPSVKQKRVVLHPDGSHGQRVSQRVSRSICLFERIPGQNPVVQRAVDRGAGTADEQNGEKVDDVLHFFSISSSIW